MKKLTLSQIEKVSAGDKVDSFCMSFGAVAAVYTLGSLANIWNPVGASALVVGGVVGVACAAYAMK